MINYLKIKLYAYFTVVMLTALLFGAHSQANAQEYTTTWRGFSDKWRDARNWTNGVPTALSHVIIPETSNDPMLTGIAIENIAYCRSLTIREDAELHIESWNGLGNIIELHVGGDVLIEDGAKLKLYGADLVVDGNWTSHGDYEEKEVKVSGQESYPTVYFRGFTSKTIGGDKKPKFSDVTMEGNVTLTRDIDVNPLRSGSYGLKVNATSTLNPQSYKVNISPKGGGGDNPFIVEELATIIVNRNKFDDNYTKPPSTLKATSIVDYAATSGNQEVLELAYGTLRISGGGTKEIKNSSPVTSTRTNLLVDGGTFDIKNFTLNRTGIIGGLLQVKNNAALRIGGTNTMPTGYNTVTLEPNSTVEYYGSNQQVARHDYGNLIFRSGGTKTFQSGSTGIAGTFTIFGATANTTANLSTVNYNGTGAQTILPINYHNLQLSTGGVKTFGAGTSGIAGAFTLFGATANATTNASTVNYNGSGAQTILPIDYHNLQLSTGGVKSFGTGTTGIANALSINSPATPNAIANSPTINYNGTGAQNIEPLDYFNLQASTSGLKTFRSGTTKIANNFTILNSATVGAAIGSIVEYNRNGNQTVAPANYQELRLTTGGVKTLGAGTTGIATTLAITSPATANATTNSSTVNFNGAGAQNIVALDYHNLQLSNTGNKTFQAGTTRVRGALTKSGSAAPVTVSNSMVEYNGNSPQTVLAMNYYDLQLSGTGTKTFETAITSIANNFTLAGATPPAVSLPVSSTVNFNGTGAQVIPALSYGSVLLSNGGIKTLAGNINVVNQLNLTNNSRINTGSNKIVLGPTATIVESEGNYVTGFVETQRNVLAGITNSFGGMGLRVTSPVAPGLVTVTRETGNSIDGVSVARNFNIVPNGTNTNLNATVVQSYLNHELNGIPEDQLYFYTSSNNMHWFMQPNANTTRSPGINEMQLTNVNSLNRMTLSRGFTPLPVDLVYFNAEKSGDNTLLTWETATEEDNLGFTVEVSTDRKNYKKIGFVSQGTGTSSVNLKYSFVDAEPGKSGNRYYRLKQQDNTGKINYFGPKVVTFEAVQNFTVKAFPNPFTEKLQLRVNAINQEQSKISVFTITGKKVLEVTASFNAGVNEIPLEFSGEVLNAGVYLVSIETGGQRHQLKVIKQ